MNQDRILLVFKFPEDDEYFMTYTSDEMEEAKKDAASFKDMYPGLLYVYIVFVYSDDREEEIFRWTNPLAAKLISLINSAGAATLSPFTMSVSVPTVGGFFRKLSKLSSALALARRPPSEGQFASPSPSTSKTYGGRNRRTRPSLRRR